MKTLGLALLLWLGASTAQAADAPEPCAPNVELRRVELSYKGQPGIWFDMDVAKCLLVAAARVPELQGLVLDAEIKSAGQADLQVMTEKMLDLAVQEADRATAGMHTAIKVRNESERQLRKPGRSRGLWFAVGLVSGLVLVGVSAYALSTVR